MAMTSRKEADTLHTSDVPFQTHSVRVLGDLTTGSLHPGVALPSVGFRVLVA